MNLGVIRHRRTVQLNAHRLGEGVCSYLTTGNGNRHFGHLYLATVRGELQRVYKHGLRLRYNNHRRINHTGNFKALDLLMGAVTCVCCYSAYSLLVGHLSQQT